MGVKQLEKVSSSNFLRAGEFFSRRLMLKSPVMWTPSFGRDSKTFSNSSTDFSGDFRKFCKISKLSYLDSLSIRNKIDF